MKRILCIALTLSLLLCLFTGCGKSASTEETTTAAGTTSAAETTAAAETAAASGAAQSGSGDAVTITVAHNMNEDPAINWLDACAEEFHKENPNINVEFDCLSGDDYITILKTKAAADDMPDVFMVDDIFREKDFVDGGYCEDLTNCDWLKNNVQDIAMNAVTMDDGHVYCVPMTIGGVFVTYNKDVFKKAGIASTPTTWTEFLKTCKTLKDSGVDAIAAGYQEQWVLYCDEQCDSVVTTVKNDRNNRLDLAAGKTTWKEDKGHFSEVLKRLRERYAYVNDDAFGTDWATALNMVATGSAAMVCNGSWTPSAIKAINPDANIGIFPLPLTDNADETLLPVHASSSGWCVNASSEKKEAAMKFAEFLSTSKAGDLMQSIKGEISANKNCTVSPDSDLYEISKYISDGKTFDYTGYSELFLSDELEEIVTDVETEFLMDPSMTVDTALSKLDERFKSALASGK